MSIAEIAAELVYNKICNLAELALLDDKQMRWIYFRDRSEEDGSLIRDMDPEDARDQVQRSRRVSWEEMFRQVKRNIGMSEEEVEWEWQRYLLENPSMVKLIERRQRLQLMQGLPPELVNG